MKSKTVVVRDQSTGEGDCNFDDILLFLLNKTHLDNLIDTIVDITNFYENIICLSKKINIVISSKMLNITYIELNLIDF